MGAVERALRPKETCGVAFRLSCRYAIGPKLYSQIDGDTARRVQWYRQARGLRPGSHALKRHAASSGWWRTRKKIGSGRVKVSNLTSGPPIRTNRPQCPGGGIGRRAGFRCQWLHGREGSSPFLGTTHPPSYWKSLSSRKFEPLTGTQNRGTARVRGSRKHVRSPSASGYPVSVAPMVDLRKRRGMP